MSFATVLLGKAQPPSANASGHDAEQSRTSPISQVGKLRHSNSSRAGLAHCPCPCSVPCAHPSLGPKAWGHPPCCPQWRDPGDHSEAICGDN